MKRFLKIFLFPSIFLISCVANEQLKEPFRPLQFGLITEMPKASAKDVEPTTVPEAVSIYTAADTLTVNNKTAVFFQPDSAQMEEQKRVVGSRKFMSGVDDNISNVSTSTQYLAQQGLPVVEAIDKKFIKFVSADNTVQVIKLDTMQKLWGAYLFDPKKAPQVADIAKIDKDFKRYFK